MTLRRVLVGVVIGVVLGVALGLVMGSVGWVRSVLEPWLTFLRALPPLAYFFLLVIWLGIDEAPKITLLALAALPPAAVATTAAVVAAPVGLTGGRPRPRCDAAPGHPRRRRPVGAAGDVHRHPARGRHGLLVGGRRRTVQRHPRHRRSGQGRQQLQQHPRRAGRHLRHRRSRVWSSTVYCAPSSAAPSPGEERYETQGPARRRWSLRVARAGRAARSTTPGSSPTSRRFASATRRFPSGDLIVKNNKWLEEALPDYNIKWTKFDSGADVNTAFIAKELDFGALGSSPVARGLSAPLNIPYKVAFVLDVAGDNEALVARNGSGVEHHRRPAGQAHRHAVRLHRALQPARRAGQNGLSPNDVQLVDLQPQAILAAWERGDIDAAYTWLPTLDELRTDRQGPDHQPAAGQGRQADARPRRGRRRLRRRASRRGRHLASAGGPRADDHQEGPERGGQGDRRRDRAQPGRGRGTAEAGRVPDARGGGLAGMARHRGQAGQHRGQPARARRSSWPSRSRSRPRRR